MFCYKVSISFTSLAEIDSGKSANSLDYDFAGKNIKILGV